MLLIVIWVGVMEPIVSGVLFHLTTEVPEMKLDPVIVSGNDGLPASLEFGLRVVIDGALGGLMVNN